MSDLTKAEEMAEQQLLGFAHARSGYGIVSLIESMGLTEDEWQHICDADMPNINDSDFHDVEVYFAEKEAPVAD